MKIPVHYSLKVVRAVISKINLPKEIAERCILESWSNGREQGHCIKCFPPTNSKSVVIAQQRNSDDILILCGNSLAFDIQTNQPSETIVQNSKICFRYNEVEKAAKHIKNFLTS